jgi:UDP-MurNAc hydroxylase
VAPIETPVSGGSSSKVLLRFINHACVLLEDDEGILLFDPWLEGLAFNNSWALLDQSTSNADLLGMLVAKEKPVTVWYSHEHPDHFSVSFLRGLAEMVPSATVCFQSTLDRRVARFIESTGLRVVELAGKRFGVTQSIDLWCWSHDGGDSFCLVRAGERWLLNMNDCVVKTREQARLVRERVLSVTSNVDVALLQFGYANWVGNPGDVSRHVEAAVEKLDRIALQVEMLEPTLVVPFASFVSFCAPENAYLNAEQNSPASLRRAPVLAPYQERIVFMASGQEVALDHNAPGALTAMSPEVERHWQALHDDPPRVEVLGQPVAVEHLVAEWGRFRGRAFRAFALLPQLLELARLITPIKVHVPDVNQILELSYLRRARVAGTGALWDVSMSSDLLSYTLHNDFGFSTTHVGGRFRIAPQASLESVARFFSVQAHLRDGWGLRHPVRSSRRFLGVLARRTRYRARRS